MSARVLNPAMMTEMSRNLGGGRTVPSRAALARVRRDLFGPVDHAAARALAEKELKAQALLDTERWGFDFHFEIPKSNSRYEWELVTSNDVVPEPYALRGMPYLRKHAPSTPRKHQQSQVLQSPQREDSTATSATSATSLTNSSSSRCTATAAVAVVAAAASRDSSTATIGAAKSRISRSTSAVGSTIVSATAVATAVTTPHVVIVPSADEEDSSAERTPPQRERSRVPEIGETTPNEAVFEVNTDNGVVTRKKESYVVVEPTTPVLPANTRKQMSITDFMKTRKRTLNGGTKSMIEPPEKVARNTGQIRS